MRSKISRKKCKSALNNIASVGDYIYGLIDYPPAIATWLLLAASGADDFLGYPWWIVGVAVPAGILITTSQAHANYVSNTVNEEEETLKEETEPGHVPELETSSSDEGASSDDDKAPLVKKGIPQKKENVDYLKIEKYMLLPLMHTTEFTDYFSAPYLVHSMITASTSPWQVGTVMAIGAVYASFTCPASAWATREAVFSYNVQRDKLAKGVKIKPKKCTIPIVLSMLAEALSAIPSYYFVTAELLDFILKLFIPDLEPYFLDLSKPAFSFGCVVGTLMTAAYLYCKSIYYLVQQPDGHDERATLPLTPLQKVQVPVICAGYTVDNLANLIFIISITTRGKLSRAAQIGLASGLSAPGVGLSLGQTKASMHCYRLFNARKANQQEDLEKGTATQTAVLSLKGGATE